MVGTLVATFSTFHDRQVADRSAMEAARQHDLSMRMTAELEGTRNELAKLRAMNESLQKSLENASKGGQQTRYAELSPVDRQLLDQMWVGAFGPLDYPYRRRLFWPRARGIRKTASMRGLDAASWTPDEPLDCSQARGTEFRREGERCWYALPVFRKLYPEYADLKEKPLGKTLCQSWH